MRCHLFLLLLILLGINTTAIVRHAGYADPCSVKIPCNPNPDKSLQCGPSGTCDCVQGNIHVSVHEGCLPEPSQINNWKCKLDPQCHLSELGGLSFCDLNEERCTCHPETEDEDVIKDVVRQGNFCFRVNEWGETCGQDVECDIAHKLKCIIDPGQGRGRCDCPEGTHWSYLNQETNRTECWDVVEPFPCQSLEVCENVIGGLAICDAREESCKCSDTSGQGRPTEFYRGKCHYVRKIDDPCRDDGECRAGRSSSLEVICDEVTHTCQEPLVAELLNGAVIPCSSTHFQILIIIFAINFNL